MENGLEYGIVANVIEPDRVFRLGAKCLLIGGTGGEGWYRFEWQGMARNGRRVKKWTPTERFGNFRAQWIRPEIRDHHFFYIMGTREDMQKCAENMNKFREELRKPKSIGYEWPHK